MFEDQPFRLKNLAKLLNPKPVFARLAWLVRSSISQSIRLSFDGFRFCLFLLTAPEFKKLRRGLPAVIVLVCSVFVIFLTYPSARNTFDQYRKLAEIKLQSGDIDASYLYSQRTSRIPGFEEYGLFGIANVLTNTNPLRANGILAYLAPGDRAGFAPAHLLRAKQIADSLVQGHLTHTLVELKWHLEHSGIMTPEKAAIWGDYHFLLGQFDQALEYYITQARQPDDRLFYIALANRSLQKNEEANEFFRRSLAFQVKQLETDLESEEKRQQLAMTLVAIGQHERAVKILEQGIAIRDSDGLRESIADVLISQHDSQKTANDASVDFELLVKAIQVSPKSSRAMERLVRYYAKDSIHRDQVKTLVEEVARKSESKVLGLFGLSLLAWKDGNLPESQAKLEEAYAIDQKSPFVANNLASLIVDLPSPDLERALRLSNDALAVLPDDARLIETRGSILHRMQRWQEAIRDLERSLTRFRNTAFEVPIRQKLFDSYSALGEESIAQAQASAIALAIQKQKQP